MHPGSTIYSAELHADCFEHPVAVSIRLSYLEETGRKEKEKRKKKKEKKKKTHPNPALPVAITVPGICRCQCSSLTDSM